MKFSQRIGLTPQKKEIQINSIDIELKNGLWNIIKTEYFDTLEKYTQYKTPHFLIFAKKLWHNFYKLPIDEIPDNHYSIEPIIRDRFFNEAWYKIYDLIEFIIKTNYEIFNKNEFIKNINNILEREFSAYRIINDIISPISNEIEINEINKTFSLTKSYTALEGANIHISNALQLLSDKQHPNYSNSIKEAISAVEATCRIITGENTLGNALKKLEEKGLDINKQLKSGFEKIYAYTNNKENGIRHAIIEEPKKPDNEDARYMLTSCSSFINYLIGKAIKTGIDFKE